MGKLRANHRKKIICAAALAHHVGCLYKVIQHSATVFFISNSKVVLSPCDSVQATNHMSSGFSHPLCALVDLLYATSYTKHSAFKKKLIRLCQLR